MKQWETQKDEKREMIRREFKFADFKQAFLFMRWNAALADLTDHHPEWFNVYNRVDVTLSTHTAGGVTLKDIVMAFAMENFEEKVKATTELDFQKAYSISTDAENSIREVFQRLQTKVSSL